MTGQVYLTLPLSTRPGLLPLCCHALPARRWPGATAAQIKAALLASVARTPSLGGKKPKVITGGRLDVARFLNTAPTASG